MTTPQPVTQKGNHVAPPTTAEIISLVEKISGYDYGGATPAEQTALARAMKLVADDVTSRWKVVRALEIELTDKLQQAGVAVGLADVIESLKPVAHTPAPPAPVAPPAFAGRLRRLFA